MKISILSALLISFLGLIWGTYIINSTSSFLNTQRVLEDHARLIMENKADEVIKESQNYLIRAQEATELTERLLRSKVLGNNNRHDLEKYFSDQLKTYPDISGIYLATPKGEFIYVNRSKDISNGGYRTKIISYNSGQRQVKYLWRDKNANLEKQEIDNQDKYNPLVRPWYIGALKKNGIFWSNPYIFYSSKNPGITISGPTFDKNGDLRGVVGVDIEIKELSSFIKKLKIGKTGKAIMISRDCDIVAYHDLSKIKYAQKDGSDYRLVKINEFQDGVFSKLFKTVLPNNECSGKNKIDNLKSKYATFKYESKNYQSMLMPFNNSKWPWLIAIYFPEDDYLGSLKSNRSFNNYITLGISVLATILAFLLSKLISRPIIGLRKFADIINNNDCGKVKLNTVFKEISETADTFRGVHDKLDKETHQRLIVEKDLKNQELEYTSLVENLNVALFRTNLEGKVLRANTMCINMLGAKNLDELKHKNAGIVYKNADDRVKMLKKLQRDGAVKAWEFEYLKFDGESGWASLYATLKVDKDGNPCYLDGIIYDITEKRQTEKLLIESERLAAVGVLAGGVAHEFNNIHTGVLGYAELGMVEPHISERVKKYFDSIRMFSLRTKNLTANLLSFASQRTTGKSISNLNKILKDTILLLEVECSTSGITIETSYGDVSDIEVDISQIGQVLLNFLINANHALLGRLDKKITVKTGEANGHSWVSVADNGCGISNEDRAKIFTPFFSTKGEHSQGRTPQSEVKGSGLGLSVCDTIVKNHYGKIEVESQLDKGSCFTLLLPIPKKNIITNNKKEKTTIESGTGNILVLDDEKDIRNILNDMLTLKGLDVITTDDGNEALEIIKSKQIDLLITDLQMPKMDGFECIKKVREANCHQPKIVILTGKLNEDIQSMTDKFDVIDVIHKPFEMVEMQDMILNYISDTN